MNKMISKAELFIMNLLTETEIILALANIMGNISITMKL